MISDNLKGSLWMMASMAAFTCNDTIMKSFAGQIPVAQAILLRGLGTVALLGAFAVATGGLRMPALAMDRWRVLLRTVAEALSAVLFIAALFHLPLANATAILQALPLTVTLAGALFLGEPVGWKRLTAILVGFVGVLLIVRPGPDGFNAWALIALASVLTITARDLATRRLSREVSSLTVAMAAAAGVSLLGGIGMVGEAWAPMDAALVLKVAGTIGFVILGYIASINAMRVGEIGAVAPFRYTSLIFALLLGLTVFGEWPDGITLLGAGIVAASGLFTLWRERRMRRRPDPAPLRIR